MTRIKIAWKLEPGDVVLYRGQPNIVETVSEDATGRCSIRLHREGFVNVSAYTKFLIGDREAAEKWL